MTQGDFAIPKSTLMRRLAATTAVAATAILASGAYASAAPTAGGKLNTTRVISQDATTSQECLAAGLSVDDCTGTLTLSTSAALSVTKNDLAAAQSSLSPEDYAELSAAVSAGAVHAKNYLQSFNNGT